MQSTWALGCALALRPARAADGRVLFGFAIDDAIAPVTTAMLKALHGRYQPDLGLKITSLPGNSGGVAMHAAHKAAADGSTVLLAPSSLMTLLPHVKKLPDIDPVSDFIPVAAISEFTAAMVVGAAVPAEIQRVVDYISWVQERPIAANYGVPALGASLHYLGVALAHATDLPLKPVAYKGLGSLVDDLRSGSLPMAFVPLSIAREAVRGGSVRMLAVASDQRWPGHLELPTLLELGLADIAMVESLGFFMPASTPASKVQLLADAVQNAVQSEPVQAAITQAGMRQARAHLRSYATALEQERTAWGEAVRKQRFSIES